MGLFSFLFGDSNPKNVTIHPDKVWLTVEAKFSGIGRQLAEQTSGNEIAILLVSHFVDVAAQLQVIAEEYKGQRSLLAVAASELSSRIAQDLNATESDRLTLIVAERHPLLEEDERILNQFAKDLPCACDVHYHASLDDPLMNVFVNDTVRKMIRMLGMKEDEAIDSNMVRRRIQEAQRKFTQNATGNAPADTAEEWMQKNLP